MGAAQVPRPREEELLTRLVNRGGRPVRVGVAGDFRRNLEHREGFACGAVATGVTGEVTRQAFEAGGGVNGITEGLAANRE